VTDVRVLLRLYGVAGSTATTSAASATPTSGTRRTL